MKKILFTVSIIIFVAGVQAQTAMLYAKTEKKIERKEERKSLRKLNGHVVSEAAKLQFFTDFGKIPGAIWKRLANFDEATFKNDGKVITVFYDDEAKLVGSTSASAFTNLPVKAQKFINKEYKDYSKGDVIFFDDNEKNETDMLLYDLQFDDEDSYFVQLKKANKTIIVLVSKSGEVSYFTSMK